MNLSEEQRKEIWTEFIKAERSAAEDADGRYPIDPSRLRQIRLRLSLERMTPLLHSPESMLPSSRLPPGSSVVVLDRRDIGNTAYFLVEAYNPTGEPVQGGWIHETALTGQTEMSTRGQWQSRSQMEQRLINEYRQGVADRYQISLDQLYEIDAEASLKQWELPSQ